MFRRFISTIKTEYSIIKKYRCGIELTERTPEALAHAIIKIHDMASDEYAILSKNAIEGVRDFDFSVLTDKLENVIQSVRKR